MVYRWKPRPAWLKQVHINPTPAVTDKPAADLTLLWSFKDTMSWSRFLDFADFNHDKPYLLPLPEHYRPQQASARSKSDGTVSWKSLVKETVKPSWTHGVSIQGAVSWTDMTRDAKDIAGGHVTWGHIVSGDEPLSASNNDTKTQGAVTGSDI